MIKRVRNLAEGGVGERLPNLLINLHERCATAPLAAERELVEQLIAVAARTSAGSSRVFSNPLDIDLLHRWVSIDGCLTAVAAMIGSQAGYMLSRASDGSAMATVVVDGQAGEHSCFGQTEALALCGAVSAALIAQLTMEPAGPEMLLH